MNKEYKIQATGRTIELDNKENPIAFSLWKDTKRGDLRFIDDRIEFFDWTIKQSEAQKVIIIKADVAFFPVSVLRIITSQKMYDFAINSFLNIQKYISAPVEVKFAKAVTKKQRYLAIGILLIISIILYLLKYK
ncbi:MAG: hypothetical protein WDA22_17370 [Bacteroidota bacterium]